MMSSDPRQITFYGVALRGAASLADLKTFYDDIYVDSFPDPDERESFAHPPQYLESAEGARDRRYHIILARTGDGEIVSGGIFNYFQKTNSGVIEFISVKRGVQSAGLSLQTYAYSQEVLHRDAHHFWGKPLSNIPGEVDSPEYNQREIPKHLHLWHKHGYRRLSFHYTQPSLSPEQEHVEGLWFVAAPRDGTWPDTMSGDYVRDVLYDYLKYCMDIPDPEQSPELRRMAADITGKTLPFTPILDDRSTSPVIRCAPAGGGGTFRRRRPLASRW